MQHLDQVMTSLVLLLLDRFGHDLEVLECVVRRVALSVGYARSRAERHGDGVSGHLQQAVVVAWGCCFVSNFKGTSLMRPLLIQRHGLLRFEALCFG